MIKVYVVLFSLLFTFSESDGQKTDKTTAFRVMTYNIKYDDKKDSINNWNNRVEKVIGLIKYNNPALLGVQEALHHQLEDMKEGLGHYEYIGAGRDDGKSKGEYSAIFYDKGAFEVIESGTFWLSENPQEPGKSWDAALPRVCTWGKFRHQPTGDVLYYYNTHFDHKGEQARLESVKVILKMIEKKAKGNKVILTGDFNFTPLAEPYKILTDKLKDTHDIAKIPHYGPDATFNGFHFHEIPENRIDYIFINQGFEIIKHATLTDSEDMHYPSDHFPVIAEMELK